MKLQIPLLYLVIAALLIILLLKDCSRPPEASPKQTVKTVVDTFLIWKVDTFYSNPKRVASVPADPQKLVETVGDDTACLELAVAHYATNVFTDTLRQDSSYVAITDSVSENQIVARSAVFSLASRVIRETTTITYTSPTRRQIYFGGEIGGNEGNWISRAGLGVLYKDRKDRIYGLGADMSFTGTVSYNLKYYRKISLR